MIGNHGIFTLNEFYNRGVIKLAPDVLVYIGGQLEPTVIAPVGSSNSNLNFNDGITSVSIQNNVDPPGNSTATIEVVTPIYGPNSKYWATYRTSSNDTARAPVFVPMLEVKIYFKGRFLVDLKPRYYPAFWGFITNIDESFNGGLFKFTLTCADMLHWWSYSSLNIHPVPESNIYTSGQQILTVYSTIFERGNPYNILYALNKNMGMHEFITPSWVAQKTSFTENYPQDVFQKAADGIMKYWDIRFKNRANLLKMYGINGKAVDKDGIQLKEPDKQPTRSTSGNSPIRQATARKDIDKYTPKIDFIRYFEIFADYDNMGTFENAEYTTKLDIATEIKTRCHFEFFQDVNGNFIFKPPFYNMNVKGLMPYTILPSDIISYSVNTDTEGIITVMNIITPMDKNLRTTPWDLGQGFHMDIDLAKRYGIRYRNSMLEYVNDERMARTMALGQMSQINAKTLTGNVTIPGRPEMRLGYPIYMEHRDSFHYVKSINHSFDYGGSFTTTLALEVERTQAYIDDGTRDRVKDNKDLIYLLSTEPTINNPPQAKKDAANKTISTPPKPSDLTPEQQMLNIQMQRKNIGGQDGLYTLQKRSADASNNANIMVQRLTTTTTSIPFSDEDGYKLIGSFPYGRNLNPVIVAEGLVEPPVFKDVYLTTMARPVYQSESEAMSVLFFKDKEGSVPSYLDFSNRQTRVLGNITDRTDNKATLTSDQQALSNPRIVDIESITFPTVPSVPQPENDVRVNQNK